MTSKQADLRSQFSPSTGLQLFPKTDSEIALSMPYKLSAMLSAHSSDVRAVVSPTTDLILSASRDSTAISWIRTSAVSPFTPSAVYRAGARYVNSIAYVPPSSAATHGYVVTGGQDTTINGFSLASSSKEEPDFSLLGHTDNVCALHTTSDGTLIISGSWDKTAKVWKDFQLLYDLKGHQQSVWAVLALDHETYLTGSADKTIKLWNQHKNINTFRGHQDAVRCLALIPDIGFASCSNDSEIRVWTLAGDPVYNLSGHTSFVYSLSVLPNGDIVSGSEDRTVRVWRDGECFQTIAHPAISVWAVSAMPNGDIVSGCSDNVVRVFSASEERWASQEALKEYDDKLASQALPSQQVGDIKKSDLPGQEALADPGKKNGEVKMIRNGGVVEAHQWDGESSSWQKIGEVVDAVGSKRKQLYQGKEYDYVFDVDFKDGAPPLKLPYNVNENAYATAQSFLERNELPLSYVDQVVSFIDQNVGGVDIGANNDYVDPFTGSSRYRGSTTSAATSAPASSFMDPFTGSSRYSGASQPTAPPATTVNILPVSKFLHFKQANVSAMQAKLYQFDEAFRQEISTYSLALYPEDIKLLDEIFSYLSHAVTSPSSPPMASPNTTHIDTIIQILERWPASQCFPVIDLSRLVTGYCPDAFAAPGLRERFFKALFRAAEWSEPWSSPLPKYRETNNLLLFRTLANAFQEGTPITKGDWVKEIMATLNEASCLSLTKPERIAMATILFNFSCLNLLAGVESDVRALHINLILRVLQSETTDSEAIYRALVALGNIMHSAMIRHSAIDSTLTEQILQSVQALPAKFSEDRIRNVLDNIGALV